MLTKISHGHYINTELLPANPVIVDVGACIGESSSELIELFPTLQIYLIEPNVRNFLVLKDKFQSNENIHLMNVALVGEDFKHSIMFTEFLGLPEWGNVTGLNLKTDHPKLKSFESYHVPTITLRNLFKQLEQIDYLKLDIEGAEHGVFETLDEVTAKKIKQFSMEIHTINGRSKEALIDRAQQLGFKTELFDEFELYAYR